MLQVKHPARQEHSPTYQKKNEVTKNIVQTKEKGENLQDQINEEEIWNLPVKEFRVIIVKMVQTVRTRMEAQIKKTQEIFNKDLEYLKNKQTLMNSTRTEMKNT